MPVCVSEEIARRSKATSVLRNELGREPTRAETLGAVGSTTPFIDAALAVSRPPISLESTVDEDGNAPLIDRLPADPDVEGTSEMAGHALLSREMRAVLIDVLTPQECTVMRLRYGLDGDEPISQQAVEERLGFSRTLVAEIEKEALRKLRRPAVAARLL